MLEEAREGGEQVAGVREAALLGLRRHVATVGFLRIAEAINSVTPARFALSPSASFSVRGEGGERGFFVVRDTASFLGATGGRFEINNETTPRIQRQPRAVESAPAFRFSSKRERWYT